jgi:hypothetical protein
MKLKILSLLFTIVAIIAPLRAQGADVFETAKLSLESDVKKLETLAVTNPALSGATLSKLKAIALNIDGNLDLITAAIKTLRSQLISGGMSADRINQITAKLDEAKKTLARLAAELSSSGVAAKASTSATPSALDDIPVTGVAENVFKATSTQLSKLMAIVGKSVAKMSASVSKASRLGSGPGSKSTNPSILLSPFYK